MPSNIILHCDDGSERELPHRWEICSHCRGDGTSSAYLGAYTSDEWREMDDEWQEDYIAGRFDRPYPHCENGKVRVPDYKRMSKADARLLREQYRAIAECDAEERAERRMMGDWSWRNTRRMRASTCSRPQASP